MKSWQEQATELILEAPDCEESKDYLLSAIDLAEDYPGPTQNAKSCPCEFEEIEPCRAQCTCKNSVMSGGCSRCCKYGSPEQQLEKAEMIVEREYNQPSYCLGQGECGFPVEK